MTLESQAILSNYEALTPLDKESRVWLVRDVTNSKIYVKKQVVCESPDIYRRLQAANIAGIPKIFHIFEDSPTEVILIEEYIHGETVESICADRLFSTEEVTDMALQIGESLKAIHGMNPPIICRDIKPSNIMVKDGKYYLTDFNIARSFEPDQKQDTHLLGTATYAPPEQYGFGQTDARSDIYSLAVTMNVMLTGKTPQEKLAQGELARVIYRATQLDPSNRYQTATAFIEAINPIRKHTFFKSETISRLKRKSTIIAIIGYALWTYFIVTSVDYVTIDGMPATPVQNIATKTFYFLLAFLPYLYNANYFDLLERTLGSYQRGTFKYWAMRIIFTLLISVILPFILVLFFI